MTSAPIDASGSLARLLPGEIHGWAPRESDGIYDASTLYDYIDGGAEVYLNLDVRRVLGRRYEKDGSPEILADIFEMGSPSGAFGSYRHDARDDGVAVGIGQESEYESGALAFWKGMFFVSVIALEETASSREAVLGIGRHIAAAIAQDGTPPGLLRLLPPRADKARAHYFRTHLSLNRYRFVSRENVLGLGPRTEGILAPCRPPTGGAGRCLILVVAYPAAAAARAGIAGFRAALAPGMDEAGGAAPADGAWHGAGSRGRILAGVLDAGSRAEVTAALDHVLASAEEAS